MTLPAFIFGSFLALLIGSLSHLILGGGLNRLIIYLILGWVGFWVGDFSSKQLGVQLFQLGPLNIGFAIIGSIVFILVGFWLSMENKAQSQVKKGDH